MKYWFEDDQVRKLADDAGCIEQENQRGHKYYVIDFDDMDNLLSMAVNSVLEGLRTQGFKVVPVEPTPDMLEHMWQKYKHEYDNAYEGVLLSRISPLLIST